MVDIEKILRKKPGMRPEFQVVIMAAGRGSRMTDLTARTPKALLPVANRPMIWYPIKYLENVGFKEAIVVVPENHLEDIRRALLETWEVKLRLILVPISPQLDWGTADSLRHIKDKITSDDLLVVSCDLITDVALQKVASVHRLHNASLTMLLAPTPNLEDTSAPGSKKLETDFFGFDARVTNPKYRRLLLAKSEADCEGKLTFSMKFLDKFPRVSIRSNLTDCHLYMMKTWVLDFLAHDTSINTMKGELVPYLVAKQFSQPQEPEAANKSDSSDPSPDKKKGDIYSFVKESRFEEVMRLSSWRDHTGDMDDAYHGTKIRCYPYIHEDGFAIRANTLVTYCEANRQVPGLLPSWYQDEPCPKIHPHAIVNQKAQTGPESMIGDGSRVSEKVGIKRSVIGNHCVIGEKVKITNSVIMDHVTIEEGATLTGSVICDNSHIGEKAELKECLVGSNHNVVAMGKFTNEVIVDVNQMMEI